MDARERDKALDYGHLAMHVGFLIIALFVAVFVCWLVLSKPTSKLYEADNVVCASQPFAMQCWERKPR
jgi:hypothetical protein